MGQNLRLFAGLHEDSIASDTPVLDTRINRAVVIDFTLVVYGAVVYAPGENESWPTLQMNWLRAQSTA
jgi:hypothetical protein